MGAHRGFPGRAVEDMGDGGERGVRTQIPVIKMENTTQYYLLYQVVPKAESSTILSVWCEFGFVDAQQPFPTWYS